MRFSRSTLASDALSLRRLWSMYTRLLTGGGFGRRDPVFAQAAFYAGARSTVKALDHQFEQGDDDEAGAVGAQGQAHQSPIC